MNIPVSKYGSSVSLRCSQGYNPVGQVSKPDLTKGKRKSKAEKKWQQGVEEGGDRPSRYPMHGTITWTTSTQCIGRRKEGCDKPSWKVQTTASTTDPIQRPWCGVRYTIGWCSFTPLRMVVTLRNVKCKILGYFLVKERRPLTWNPFVNNSIVNWNSSFPSWLTIVIIPLNQGWGSVST